ncbi:NADPH-dependent assimilatory sulfite reductase hemoprotein subunit [Chromohalobacter canadensis]|uniref:NADPH-dependent assimilatory sulfite reductase hemoprotein subunit n=1 Tax=Chromohalobacter canadensis TaxID=141389 RepID=UPI0021C0AF3C|nr:NADPH-dependent assimilatory sulfite reductase hemoprotein subunit [Chromohalobacter canadensis]MCT8468607.1 NADPH-dependent assimilatory sulfite reductase hemoprotein subunit [Chromohalobacter canadensis]MCT8471662.1 NADPH-dependent assimilatory sulfite reductase hemoprotein subunit [Chromohalobacter canadensis]MCT8499115.1 NADPH-dependent assimilatory sulfite reductase hemoprotein subunit [Chromohalobacter canadensis]
MDIIAKMRDVSLDELHPNERLKVESHYLYGTLEESLADRATGAVNEADTQLTKFHGFYQQDDRDVRDDRRHRKLEPLYSFMVRLRLPGGQVSPEQWLTLDDNASRYANGTLRITTRQTFQYHGVFKENLRGHLQALDKAMMDTIAACGDVNRNVICTANPHRSPVHRQVYDLAHEISAHLLPSTRAYHEIFLGEERVAGGPQESGDEVEPLYTRHYLPRKFKVALAIPPENDVDVFAHDVGFIADVQAGELKGFNVCIGGGMGMTHGETATFPRLSDIVGYCTPDRAAAVSEAIMLVQRDNGNRHDRKQARLKYTVEALGVDGFRERVEEYLGESLAPARELPLTHNGDRLGWYQGEDGLWHYGLFVQNGRLADVDGGAQLMSGMREIAKAHDGDIVLTTNQNLIITQVPEARREAIDTLLADYAMTFETTPLRRHAMACVAFPTCGLAMAESERYLPSLIDRLEAIMQDAGLGDDAIIVRMTGCPNGCARPYLAEIGFVGKTLGRYNLYLGGGFAGERLNKLYRENIDEATILEELTPLIQRYAAEREAGEAFGDFVVRAGVIAPTLAGREFHAR